MKLLRILFMIVGVMGVILFGLLFIDIMNGRQIGALISPQFRANTDTSALILVCMMGFMSFFMFWIVMKADKI